MSYERRLIVAFKLLHYGTLVTSRYESIRFELPRVPASHSNTTIGKVESSRHYIVHNG